MSRDLSEAVRIAREHGYWIELTPEHIEMYSGQPIVRSVHLPYKDINLTHPDEGLREQSIEAIKEAIRKTAPQAKLGVLHFERVPPPVPQKERLRYFKTSLNVICREAEKRGMEIVLENLPYKPEYKDRHMVTPSQVEEVLRATGLRLCLDVGHANTASKKFGFPIDRWLDKFGDKTMIRWVHIHENDGLKDQHLPLQGLIDDSFYAKLLGLIIPFGGVTLEINADIALIDESRRKLESLAPQR